MLPPFLQVQYSKYPSAWHLSATVSPSSAGGGSVGQMWNAEDGETNANKIIKSAIFVNWTEC